MYQCHHANIDSISMPILVSVLSMHMPSPAFHNPLIFVHCCCENISTQMIRNKPVFRLLWSELHILALLWSRMLQIAFSSNTFLLWHLAKSKSMTVSDFLRVICSFDCTDWGSLKTVMVQYTNTNLENSDVSSTNIHIFSTKIFTQWSQQVLF